MSDFVPDKALCLRHIQRLFARCINEYPDGLIQIQPLDPNEGAPPACRYFPVSESGFDNAADYAMLINQQGYNVYVGVNPRRPGTIQNAKDDDIEISFYNFIDCDTPESVAAFNAASDKPRARLKLITGDTPSLRIQAYQELLTPNRNMDAWKEQQRGLIAYFGSDSAIHDPRRIMRLAGCISRPTPAKKAKGYTPYFVRFDDAYEGAEQPIEAETLYAAFPYTEKTKDKSKKSNQSSGEKSSPDELIENILSGDNWHDNLLRLIAHWVVIGMSDRSMMEFANLFTLHGFTVEKTRADMRQMIDGARAKWDRPKYSEDSDAYRSTPTLDATDHSGIAHKIVEAKFYSKELTSTLLRSCGMWYEHKVTCYMERDEEGIRAVVRKYLDQAFRLHNGIRKPFRPKPADINAVMDALRTATYAEMLKSPSWNNDKDMHDPKEIISLTNGLLHIPTRILQKHTANFFTLNALPYAWVEGGEPIEWLGFLDSIWPDDIESQKTLQEIFGYLLTADTSQQKMFLIKGPKRSGKGTIGRVLKTLLGDANICGPTLSSLTGSFGLQPLISKLVAIVPDARISGKNQQLIVEHLLMISGEDTVTVNRKNKESWTGTLPTRFIIFTNETPQLLDASGALASRFIVLATRQSFYGIEDKTLDCRLLKELPQILLWALEGKDRLNDRGYFIQPSSAADAVEELQEVNSPILIFVGEVCDVGEKYEEETIILFEEWRSWCRNNGRDHPGTIQSFGKILSAAVPSIRKRKLGGDDDRKPVYMGIRIKTEVKDKISLWNIN